MFLLFVYGCFACMFTCSPRWTWCPQRPEEDIICVGLELPTVVSCRVCWILTGRTASTFNPWAVSTAPGLTQIIYLLQLSLVKLLIKGNALYKIRWNSLKPSRKEKAPWARANGPNFPSYVSSCGSSTDSWACCTHDREGDLSPSPLQGSPAMVIDSWDWNIQSTSLQSLLLTRFTACQGLNLPLRSCYKCRIVSPYISSSEWKNKRIKACQSGPAIDSDTA